MSVRRILAGCVLMLSLSAPVGATVLYSSSVESRTCDTNVTGTTTFEGADWVLTGQDDPNWPLPYFRCALIPPNGSRYVEWLTYCQTVVSGRCSPGNNNTQGTLQAQTDVDPTASITLSQGATYYLGAAFRFDKVNNHNIWQDGAGQDSFDKLFEFRFTGGRWGIGAGRHGNFTGNYNGKILFDMWAATTSECTQCAGASWGAVDSACYYDHKYHNQSPYTRSTPFQADYGHWYNVVIAVTMSSTVGGGGRIQEWINGNKVIDCNGPTMQAGTGSTTSFSFLTFNGTIAQPAYDAPPHYRRADNLVFADSLTDMENAGLMADPEAGGGGGPPTVTGGRSGGRLVIFVEQAVAYLLLIGQLAMVLGYLWERRAALVRGLVAVHQAYWLIRYRRAVRAWQRAAPVMIEECGGEVVELTKREAVWRQK